MFPKSITSKSSYPSKSFNFQWEKRHWILVIGLACLLFWYFAPFLKSLPWLQSSLNLLPILVSLALALDAIVKLAD